MSMKRSKATSKRAPSNRELARSPLFATGKKDEPKFNWKDSVGNAPENAFVPYALSTKYDRGALISHAKFGRGVVTAVDEKRIEVMFEEGAKKLGHDTAD
ncbi:MAG: hypothetical protein IT381_15780 [Deltaproteobacteria bacterium]|nr:hypothetical protein [Deltaproteobacteria bacterium]